MASQGIAGLSELLGVALPSNCEVHFVIRPVGGEGHPTGGFLPIQNGEVGKARLRARMAGTVSTSWPSAPPVGTK